MFTASPIDLLKLVASLKPSCKIAFTYLQITSEYRSDHIKILFELLQLDDRKHFIVDMAGPKIHIILEKNWRLNLYDILDETKDEDIEDFNNNDSSL